MSAGERRGPGGLGSGAPDPGSTGGPTARAVEGPVQEVARVLACRRAGAYFALTLVAPGVARRVRAGQFVEVRAGPEGAWLLPRPFSVHRADRARPGLGTIEVVFEVIGAATAALAHARPHDRIDLIGPLGRPFTLPPAGAACALVGGGYGAAPLFLLAEEVRARGCRVDMVLGAATAARLLKPVDAKRVSTSLTVTTEDGSAGTTGLVTDVLPGLLARARSRMVLACGPMPMLAAVSRVAAEAGVACEVSVEQHMACGTGICFTCVVPVHTPEGTMRMARSCLEGPVLDGRALAWHELGYQTSQPASLPASLPPAASSSAGPAGGSPAASPPAGPAGGSPAASPSAGPAGGSPSEEPLP